MVNGVALQADVSGAVLWPERRLAVVADLHFEKGTAFAARGQLLPPYDTAATLDKVLRSSHVPLGGRSSGGSG